MINEPDLVKSFLEFLMSMFLTIFTIGMLQILSKNGLFMGLTGVPIIIHNIQIFSSVNDVYGR